MDGDLSTVRLSSSFDTRYGFEVAFQLHRFEVNQHPIAYIMSDLLKSGMSASLEEAIEEMKESRSTTDPWCQSRVTPEDGRAYFMTDLSSEVIANYPNAPDRPKTLFMYFLRHC
ncbi:hypothetical protein F2Q70_00027179 [Brassica cretica]|uniref:Uncharacterized protein n=1 Tax=Brassica cretica TaxID=69181 RepID=A0A8S9L959_BRACR|nr:hypothetical protein F2Q70_00027179 [Brassica cretica]